MDTRPDAISHIYTTAVRPVLTYGLECVYQGKTVMQDVEMLQSKLLKSSLGLKRYCRNTPLLQALKIQHVCRSVEIQELILFKSMLLSSSRSHKFYQFILACHIQGAISSQRNIVSRILKTCDKHNISLAGYLCNESHLKKTKCTMKQFPACGLSDSVSFILNSSSRDMYHVNSLLSPF